MAQVIEKGDLVRYWRKSTEHGHLFNTPYVSPNNIGIVLEIFSLDFTVRWKKNPNRMTERIYMANGALKDPLVPDLIQGFTMGRVYWQTPPLRPSYLKFDKFSTTENDHITVDIVERYVKVERTS